MFAAALLSVDNGGLLQPLLGGDIPVQFLTRIMHKVISNYFELVRLLFGNNILHCLSEIIPLPFSV